MIKLIEHKLIKEAPVLNTIANIEFDIKSLSKIDIKDYNEGSYDFSIWCNTDIDAIANIKVYTNKFDSTYNNSIPIAQLDNAKVKIVDVDLYYYDFQQFLNLHLGDGERDVDINEYDFNDITEDMIIEDVEEALLGNIGYLPYHTNTNDIASDINNTLSTFAEGIEFGDNYVNIELDDDIVNNLINQINTINEAASDGVEYDYCTKTTLANIKKGEYFTFVPVAEPREAQVWVKDDYNRSTKKYIVYKWANTSAIREFPGTKEVYIDFTF